MRKGKMSFIQKLHNLGGWQSSVSKLIFSGKPRGKPSYPMPGQSKGVPRVSSPSFGNHRWLLHDHPGDLASSGLLPGFRLFPGNLCVGPAPQSATRFQGPSGLTKHWPAHPSAGSKRECTSPFLHII